ncbi:MAG TPA: rod shape-determining protein RodA, partial [Thermoanaerobaculia bacterium]|nr:rod shape-determining protein RodA [Thermoanaerobaculia bacterium]
IGLATVHSASAELAIDYLPRQAIWVGIGLAACAAAFAVDHRLLLAFAVPLYLLSVLLLLLVLVVGHEAGGAQGWLRVAGVGFQPSELAKLATALLLARMLARVGRGHLTGRDTARALAVVALPMALTAVEPDLGGAAMFLPVVLGMLFVCGLPWRLVAAAVLLALVTGGLAWGLFMKPYQKERVLTFLDAGRDPRGAGYQARQSKIAVGSGELTGKGYMQGSQSQLRFLPARHTDFILAVLAEERGFLGVATVLLLYGVFLANGGAVAMRARDRSGLLLVAGLLSMIGFHVLYNSAMVIGLVPITGIPIPFLSYGGTFTVVCFAATGLILGVDYRRYVNR